MTDDQREDSHRELERHEQAIADLCATLAAIGAPTARADVLFLNAQVIRHRISAALIASRLEKK